MIRWDSRLLPGKIARTLQIILLIAFIAAPAAANAAPAAAAQLVGALVLVNSQSAGYGDFASLIQPYLDHFGIPYTVLDISAAPLPSDAGKYALIVIGHSQIDSYSTYLNSTEQAYITNAVNLGTGLVNFDNALSAFITPDPFFQTIFNFSYVPPASGSGVQLTSAAHTITTNHPLNEVISTGSMNLAGITLPAGATALATTGGVPFLAVENYGAGRAVQWGTYDWMKVSVKGPVYGLDDLVWRSMVWAARKPFVMQGLPPMVTMRVDDSSGPYGWVHAANAVGFKPSLGVFMQNVDDLNAIDLSFLANTGQATVSIHELDSSPSSSFYWGQTNAQAAANFASGTAWHQSHGIPISRYVLSSDYQFSDNAFPGLAGWGVECVGTHMSVDQVWGSPWMNAGPYRVNQGGSSSAQLPVSYADYIPTIPNQPGYNGQFFNLVTEIRDDMRNLDYRWYPTDDAINLGAEQLERAMDSMVLGELYTHEPLITAMIAARGLAAWQNTLAGISQKLAEDGYNPSYVTMDTACQYLRSKVHTKIANDFLYDNVTGDLTVSFTNLSGIPTEIQTKFYVFVGDANMQGLLFGGPQPFTGTTPVTVRLPGGLQSIVVSPETSTLVSGAIQQFTAKGFDGLGGSGNPIPGLAVTWSADCETCISDSGVFTASDTPGTYTVTAAAGTVSGTATVTVVAPSLHHFALTAIPSPQYMGAPIAITISARDAANNVLADHAGQAILSLPSGQVTPGMINLVNGTWTGTIQVSGVTGSTTLTVSGGGASGASNSFTVHSRIWLPMLRR